MQLKELPNSNRNRTAIGVQIVRPDSKRLLKWKSGPFLGLLESVFLYTGEMRFHSAPGDQGPKMAHEAPGKVPGQRIDCIGKTCLSNRI